MSHAIINGVIPQFNPYTLTQSEFEASKSAQVQALSTIVKALAELACKLPPPANQYDSSPSLTVMNKLSETVSLAQNIAGGHFYPMQPPVPGPIPQDQQ